MAMEFEVLTDLVPVSSTTIETNFMAVKEWLTETLAPYKTMIVTPDAIADAKKDRASIRKVADSIDAQRKAIKKEWMKPYDEYERQCKELTGIVGEAVANIDSQIKAMENELKEEKRQELEQFFIISSIDVADYISFSDVFDPRWLNSTFKMEEAMNAISARVFATQQDLETIRGMESPYEAVMLTEYSKSHDLRSAIQEAKRLEAIQRAEEERKAREAEATMETPNEPEEAPIDAPEAPAPIPPQFSPIQPIGYEEPPKPKTYVFRFEIEGTMDELRALRAFFDKNSLHWRKI